MQATLSQKRRDKVAEEMHIRAQISKEVIHEEPTVSKNKLEALVDKRMLQYYIALNWTDVDPKHVLPANSDFIKMKTLN